MTEENREDTDKVDPFNGKSETRLEQAIEEEPARQPKPLLMFEEGMVCGPEGCD